MKNPTDEIVSRAEWREAEVRGELEGEARLKQVRLSSTRPRLPGDHDVMSLNELDRVHREPWRRPPVEER